MTSISSILSTERECRRIIGQEGQNVRSWLDDAHQQLAQSCGRQDLAEVWDRMECIWASMQQGQRFFDEGCSTFSIEESSDTSRLFLTVKKWQKDARDVLSGKEGRLDSCHIQDTDRICSILIAELSLRSEDQKVYVLKDTQGRVVSMAVATFSPYYLVVDALATAPCLVGRGMGSKIMKYLEGVARSRAILLSAFRLAAPFYAARGYYIEMNRFLEGTYTMIKPAPGQPLVLVDGRSQPPQ